MAGSRKASPIGIGGPDVPIDSGTLCRSASPIPGPLCVTRSLNAAKSVKSKRPSGVRRPLSAPIRRKGDIDTHVKKIQLLLNSRLDPSPELRVDGIFGSMTHRAVLEFQSSRSIKVDGVVGKTTWYHLVSGTLTKKLPPRPPRGPISSPARVSSSPKLGTAMQSTKGSVFDWSLEERFTDVANRVPQKLPAEFRSQFLGLVSIQSLVIALVALALSCVFGVGELVMLGMLLILGEQVVIELGEAIQITALAASEQELDEAADHLARAFAIAGVAALLGAFAKFARAGGVGTPNEEVVPEEKPTQREILPGKAKTPSAGSADEAPRERTEQSAPKAGSGFDPTPTFRDGKYREVTLKPGTKLPRAYQEGVNKPVSPFMTDAATAQRITGPDAAIEQLALKGTSDVRPDRIVTIEVTREIKAKVGYIEGGGEEAVQYVVDPNDLGALRVVPGSERTLK